MGIAVYSHRASNTETISMSWNHNVFTSNTEDLHALHATLTSCKKLKMITGNYTHVACIFRSIFSSVTWATTGNDFLARCDIWMLSHAETNGTLHALCQWILVYYTFRNSLNLVFLYVGVYQQFLVDSRESFIHIHHSYFSSTSTVAWYAYMDNDMSASSTGAHLTMPIRIRYKSRFTEFLFLAIILLQILHMPWHHSCRIICKNLGRSVLKNFNRSEMNFIEVNYDDAKGLKLDFFHIIQGYFHGVVWSQI